MVATHVVLPLMPSWYCFLSFIDWLYLLHLRVMALQLLCPVGCHSSRQPHLLLALRAVEPWRGWPLLLADSAATPFLLIAFSAHHGCMMELSMDALGRPSPHTARPIEENYEYVSLGFTRDGNEGPPA
jgi:hypothetical protein